MFPQKSISDYTEILSSDSPVPGGGSALAVVAANAVALAEMAANVTASKLKKNGGSSPLSEESAATLKEIRCRILRLADADPDAFTEIIRAMRLPKNSEEEKTTRKNALQEAYVKGAQIPLKLMENAVQAYNVTETVIGEADPFVVSDAYIGRDLLRTVVVNSARNVEVNVNCLSDATLAQKLRDRTSRLIAAVTEEDGTVSGGRE